ncbi:hypothetical protein CDAR_390371 [Caerostris darwini]|uniref:Uncharacterized protein n=1 Tax=Caerostris darwini TaxID=1538125 RepID=A0AAV4NXJ5_9ARAC|nr:hypothetical protein CDAR_390371 [Caerostris darwini]
MLTHTHDSIHHDAISVFLVSLLQYRQVHLNNVREKLLSGSDKTQPMHPLVLEEAEREGMQSSFFIFYLQAEIGALLSQDLVAGLANESFAEQPPESASEYSSHAKGIKMAVAKHPA